MQTLGMGQLPESFRNELKRFCVAVNHHNTAYLMGCFTTNTANNITEIIKPDTRSEYVNCVVEQVSIEKNGYRVELQLDHETHRYLIAMHWEPPNLAGKYWMIVDVELLSENSFLSK